MLEKDIENLIAKHPEDFFPKSRFKLIGQQVKLGRCYADILFEDEHKRKIIVEVKRGILQREHSGQVMEYYGLLKNENPNNIVELILCANIIPSERRSFLETAGIECKELGINFINQVAEKHKYSFLDSERKMDKSETIKIHTPIENEPLERKVWIFQANPERYDILNALDDPEVNDRMNWLVKQNTKDIHQGDLALIWLSGKEAGIYALANIIGEPGMMYDTEGEKKYWLMEKDIIEKDAPKFQVNLSITKKLVNTPVLRILLKQTKGLENLSILKMSQGTNFLVTKNEWIIIQQLINTACL
jgi:predicted RNA-binding protein with PUA-like domain